MTGEISATLSALSYAIGVIFFRISTLNFKTIPLVTFNTTFTFFLFLLSMILFKSYPTDNLILSDYIKIAVSGIIGVSFGDLLYIYSLSKLGASLAAIVTCLYAPFVVILAFLIFGEGISITSFIGGILILLSIIIVVPKKKDPTKNFKVPAICAIVSVLMMAYAVLMIRDIFRKESLLFVVSVRFLFATIIIWSIAFFSGQFKNCVRIFYFNSLAKWVLGGAFFGSFLSVLLWFVGFKYIIASKAAIYNQLSTIFIVILASIFLKEKLTLIKILAVSLAFTGAILNSI